MRNQVITDNLTERIEVLYDDNRYLLRRYIKKTKEVEKRLVDKELA